MRTVLIGAMLVLVAASPLGAQAAPRGSPESWKVSGTLGAQFRTEHGTLIDGATIGVGVIFPSSSRVRWNAEAAVVQVLARAPVGGQRVSAVESSIEGGVLATMDLLRLGDWRLEGGAGPIAALSVGCGRFQRDPVDTTAGSRGCVNSFAHRGDGRIGARARLLGEWMSPRASFFVALIASANTVASGNHVAPGVLAGVRAPLR